MPKRRRTKRQKRRNPHWHHLSAIASVAATEQEEQQQTEGQPMEDESDFVTLPQITTPLQTPRVRLRSRSSFFGSPITRNRSESVVTTPRILRNGTIALRNLLEDGQSSGNITPVHLNNMTPRRPSSVVSPYIDNLASVSATVLNRRLGGSTRLRSNSSASKLRSPGKERTPLTVDVSTQTVELEKKEETMYFENCINIFETPKINQADLLDRDITPISRKSFMDPISNKFNRMKFKKLQNFSEILRAENSPIIFRNDLRLNVSDAELSFQHLLDSKSSSTPIEKIKNDLFIENFAKTVINQNAAATALFQKHETAGPYIYRTPKTPYTNNLNALNKEKISPQKQKKFDCNASVIKRRCFKSVSPKKPKDLGPKRRIAEKKRNNNHKGGGSFIPKSFTPPAKMAACHSKSENILSMSAEGGRLMSKVKKFHTRYVAKWIARISELCAWLGLTLKKSLVPKSTPTPDTITSEQPLIPEIINTTVPPVCKDCETHRLKMVVLASKVEVLERELFRSTEESRGTIAQLVEEISKIRHDLSEIGGIKQKLNDMEEAMRSKPGQSCGPPPPPPPCLPPPPPPPPPPMMLLNLASPIARPRIGTGKKNDKKSNENSRPVISLDDILKVKLKKTTDKPLSARRVQQPVISVDMLNQIKLRPTSRPQTPCSAKDLSVAAAVATSPASSLSKILSSVDTNVRRVKRLRRIGGYSLDDSRRRVMRREWCGTDDT